MAFKPQVGVIYIDFGRMSFEVDAVNEENKRQRIGRKTLGELEKVKVDDHVELQRIRSFVKWKNNLPLDQRVGR